jgi:putative DNA primase/helicase
LFEKLARGTVKPNVDGKNGYEWDTKKKLWKEKSSAMLKNSITYTIQPYIDNIMNKLEEKDEEVILKITNALKKCGNAQFTSGVWRYVHDQMFDEDFQKNMNNSDPDSLPVKNGKLLNLATGEVRDRTMEDLYSFELDVEYQPSDSYPNAEKFFLDISNGDEELMKYHQKSLGYSITGHTSEISFGVWYGDGSNGKGSLCNLLRKILGRYYVAISKDVFIKCRGAQAGAATPQLMPLSIARLAVFAESEKNEVLNDGLLKSLSGQDPISVRPLYGKQIEIQPQAKYLLQTNHYPRIDVTDEAMKNRFKLIPFSAVFKTNPKGNEKKKDAQFVKDLGLSTKTKSFHGW